MAVAGHHKSNIPAAEPDHPAPAFFDRIGPCPPLAEPSGQLPLLLPFAPAPANCAHPERSRGANCPLHFPGRLHRLYAVVASSWPAHRALRWLPAVASSLLLCAGARPSASCRSHPGRGHHVPQFDLVCRSNGSTVRSDHERIRSRHDRSRKDPITRSDRSLSDRLIV